MTKLLNLVRIATSVYIFFNRSPDRLIAIGENFVAPADGTIVDIKNNKIDIFIGLLDVHRQRAPYNGVVTNIFEPNKEYSLIEIDTRLGHVAIERWAGEIAKTIVTDIKLGAYISKGDIIGKILLGSHCSITIPPYLNIKVSKGQRVIAGETIIADTLNYR